MIKIEKPYITECDGRVRLVSHITNGGEGKELDLYYSVEPQYGQFLCDETVDAFVLPMLLRAVLSCQEIVVEAPMSERLYHNLRYGVLYALKHARQTSPKVYGLAPITPNDNLQNIGISCSELVANNYHGKAVGTGCSLGVDSFSVIKKYLLDNDCLQDYKITHFACFNVGAFGSFNTDTTRASFYREVDKLKSFAEKLHLPVVSVDSNVHDFYLEQNFNWSHTYLNMGCVLALQRLWGKYLYASGYSLDCYRYDFGDSARMEPVVIPNIATESTELISADMEKTRSEKVRFIMDDEIVKQNINVCLKEQSINNGVMEREAIDDHRNCGHCEKCLRTMLQLDIFGRLNDYRNVFDLSDWTKMRDDYLVKVLSRKDLNLMYKDIASTIIANAYPISSVVKYRVWLTKMKQIVKAIVRSQK